MILQLLVRLLTNLGPRPAKPLMKLLAPAFFPSASISLPSSLCNTTNLHHLLPTTYYHFQSLHPFLNRQLEYTHFKRRTTRVENMQFKASLVALAFAASALAQDLSQLPECATGPALQAFQGSSCPSTDIACICSDTAFLQGLQEQLVGVCSPEELESK